MPERHIATIYSLSFPATTGTHITAAFKNLGYQVEHFQYDKDVDCSKFDIVLRVDDGFWIRQAPNRLLQSNKCKTAYLMIDSHTIPIRLVEIAQNGKFDHLFCAQEDGSIDLQNALQRPVKWLPLAADSAMYTNYLAQRDIDVSFIGGISKEREEFLSKLIKECNKNNLSYYFGALPYQEMCRIYRRSRFILSLPISNDISMRPFEALISGASLLQPSNVRIPMNFIKNQEDICYFLSIDDIIDAIRHRVCTGNTQKEVVKNHCYETRCNDILQTVGLL